MIGTTAGEVEGPGAAAAVTDGTETAISDVADDDDDEDEETDDDGKVCAFNCHFSVGTAW